MAILIPRGAIDRVAKALQTASLQCCDMDGVAVEPVELTQDELTFAVLGAMIVLYKNEVLIDDMLLVSRSWPNCREVHNLRELVKDGA